MADDPNFGSGFGSFVFLCKNVPSFYLCNLYYRQLRDAGFTLEPPQTAPVGINADCGIPLGGRDGRLGNIANMVLCGVSVIAGFLLALQVSRRRAAVGRVELLAVVLVYTLSAALQLVTTGAVIAQGSTALVILTAIHAGIVAALFWGLLANGIVATQVVEDGTLSSLIPYSGFSIAFFIATTYIALDTGFTFTNAFVSNPPGDLKNLALFVLTLIWPPIAAILYYILMSYVILVVLREKKPMLYLTLSFVAFAGSQVVFFLANEPLCKVSTQKVDGSFIATLLETLALVLLVITWGSVTEETWEDDRYY